MKRFIIAAAIVVCLLATGLGITKAISAAKLKNTALAATQELSKKQSQFRTI